MVEKAETAEEEDVTNELMPADEFTDTLPEHPEQLVAESEQAGEFVAESEQNTARDASSMESVEQQAQQIVPEDAKPVKKSGFISKQLAKLWSRTTTL